LFWCGCAGHVCCGGVGDERFFFLCRHEHSRQPQPNKTMKQTPAAQGHLNKKQRTNPMWEHPTCYHAVSPTDEQRSLLKSTAHFCKSKSAYLYETRCSTHLYTTLGTQSVRSFSNAGQSALTATIASSSSDHQAGYKKEQLQPSRIHSFSHQLQ
jgi:hypothetical protein